ncbi:hypothetical protein SK128_024296 [Halocaridina rubra]|uniref:Uncharacterized protein n=1 Tax=Halocaridina rubra TaxID=373956 RepID=A0AAN9AD27_HALRR
MAICDVNDNRFSRTCLVLQTGSGDCGEEVAKTCNIGCTSYATRALRQKNFANLDDPTNVR